MENCSNFKSSQEVISYQPALSSQDLNWDGMIFNCYLNSPLEISEHIQPDHLLCMALNATEKEEKHDGKFTAGKNIFGSFGIVPQGFSYAGSFNKEPQYISLSIKPKKLLEFAPDSFIPENIRLIPCSMMEPDSLITGILMNFKKEIEAGVEPNDPLIDYLQDALLAHLLQNYCTKEHTFKSHNGLSRPKLKQVIDYIDNNLNQGIRVSNIAKLLNISPGYLWQLFKKSMEVSLHEYILEQRIETAKKLIKNNQAKLSLGEIAKLSGFSSSSYFSRRFTQVVGVNPRHYRNYL